MAQKTIPGTAPSAAGGDFWRTRAARTGGGKCAEEASPAALRHGVRRPVPLVAMLNYRLTYSIPLHVRNLSLTDAYVEMPMPDLEVGASVEFVLRYHYRDEPVELRLAARVARAEPEGVALQFGDYDDSTYTHLVKLLYAL